MPYRQKKIPKQTQRQTGQWSCGNTNEAAQSLACSTLYRLDSTNNVCRLTRQNVMSSTLCMVAKKSGYVAHEVDWWLRNLGRTGTPLWIWQNNAAKSTTKVPQSRSGRTELKVSQKNREVCKGRRKTMHDSKQRRWLNNRKDGQQNSQAAKFIKMATRMNRE